MDAIMDRSRGYAGGCSSAIFAKDVDNMLPFTSHSPWNFASTDGVSKRTTSPMVTGTSVLGVVFNKGVMICADTLGSYGSTARFVDVPRVLKINDQTILGAGGDIADFQRISSIIEQQVIDEECLNDGFNLKPKSLHCWLTRCLYNRRSKFDPLWNIFIVGGMQDGEPFLGLVDKIGTAFESPTLATGYGAYIAQPLLRAAYEKDSKMSSMDARQLLIQCMETLYYRDARAFPKFTIATVTEEGAKVEGPFEITGNWNVAYLVDGYE